MTTKHLFISYRSIEREFALKLACSLMEAGYPVWMDYLGGILPAAGWRAAIQNAVNDSVAMVACLSPNYISSTWCIRELQRADALQKSILPVVTGDIPDKDWPMVIQDHQYVDFRKWEEQPAYDEGFKKVLVGIQQKFGLQAGPSTRCGISELQNTDRDDPEDLAEQAKVKLEKLEKGDDFAAVEAAELRKDLEVWMDMYKAAARQNRRTLNESDRVKLQLQMSDYKADWEEINSKLKGLE